ncbi:hypothetical protein F4803DRAFT_529697 [Xylaria telfairii]|nr:hypothetical protein F4803DRAFT_529697 [Xylaria telfairii]
MCDYNSLCGQDADPSEVDPDIVGIGVIISFVASSVITFLTVVGAYCLGWIHPEMMNDVDEVVIGTLHRNKTRFDNEDDSVAKNRFRAFEKYILTLSDQQLVTGLSIQIAAYVNACNVSVASYTIIQALAWFSCTTHLSALTITNGYLREHPKARIWRTIGMIITLVLLFIGVIIPTTPSWGGDDDYVYCALSDFVPTTDGLVIFNAFTINLFLFINFADQFTNIYATCECSNAIRWLMKRIWSVEIPGDDHIKELWAKIHQEPATTPGIRDVHFQLIIICVLRDLMDSFLWKLFWVLFGNVFGIVQIARLREGLGDIAEANAWGFGQVVPLLLLALPIFGAVDTYFEGRQTHTDQDRNERGSLPDQSRNSTNQIEPRQGTDSTPIEMTAALPSPGNRLAHDALLGGDPARIVLGLSTPVHTLGGNHGFNSWRPPWPGRWETFSQT